MTFVPNNYIIWVFLSTPSARRATHAGSVSDAEYDISIHALREEGDGYQEAWADYRYISIHALREEGDLIALVFFAV